MEIIIVLFAMMIWVMYIVLIAFAIALPLSYILPWVIDKCMKISDFRNKG